MFSATTTLARIIFTGVVTFVGPDDHEPLSAIFVNGSGFRPVHHVYVVVGEEWEVEHTLPYELSPENKPSPVTGKNFTVFELSGVQLEPGDNVTNRSLELVDCDPTGTGQGKYKGLPPCSKSQRPTDMVDATYLRWIPTMTRVVPKFFWWTDTWNPKPGFSESKPDLQRVDARVPITAGKLASHWVTGDVWKFGPRWRLPRTHKQAIAQEVRLDVTLDTPALRLDVYDLKTGEPLGAISVMRKASSPPGVPITLTIANVPAKEALPSSNPPICRIAFNPVCPGDPFPCTCVDHHFALYYEGMYIGRPIGALEPVRVHPAEPVIPSILRVSGGGSCGPTGYP